MPPYCTVTTFEVDQVPPATAALPGGRVPGARLDGNALLDAALDSGGGFVHLRLS